MSQLTRFPIFFALMLFAAPVLAQDPDRGQAPPPTVDAPAPPDLRIQEWLLSRNAHEDYQKATFSFEAGLRDDPDLEETRNDWELIFDNDPDRRRDSFGVRMVRDDISLIADLGPIGFDEVDPNQAAAALFVAELPCIVDHLYVLHSMDGDSDQWSLLRVVEHRRNDSVRIQWVSLDPGSMRTSPDVKLDDRARKRITVFVKALDRVGGLRLCRRESDGASEQTFDALADTNVRDLPTDLGGVIDRIRATPRGKGTEIAIDLPRVSEKEMATWRAVEVPTDVRIRSLEAAFEAATRAARLSWLVRTDGSIVVRRM
ncbi:MAG: hypothetical protein AB7I19_07695 [Planctomycetota bacterium]